MCPWRLDLGFAPHVPTVKSEASTACTQWSTKVHNRITDSAVCTEQKLRRTSSLNQNYFVGGDASGVTSESCVGRFIRACRSSSTTLFRVIFGKVSDMDMTPPHNPLATKRDEWQKRVNTMVREILRLIDVSGILRKPTWDGVRTLLLLLPLFAESEGITAEEHQVCFLALLRTCLADASCNR
jgi:hypothetical protein